MDYEITELGGFRYKGDKMLLTGEVVIPDGVTRVDSLCDCPNITSIIVPEGVVAIDNHAFEQCTNLTHISLPSTLRIIGNGVFWGCSSLKSLFIPANVSLIAAEGLYMFLKCFALEKIVVDEDNEHYCSVDGVLYSKDMTELIAYPIAKPCEEYTVPQGVKDISARFWNCKTLQRLTLPDGLEHVARALFMHVDFEVVINGTVSGVTLISNAFARYEGVRIIAPEIWIELFITTEIKRKAALGYAKAKLCGMTTGSDNNVLYEKYIRSQRRYLYKYAAEDIWMMRYMTQYKVIAPQDISKVLDLIPSQNTEIRALLLEYSGSADNNTEYRI